MTRRGLRPVFLLAALALVAGPADAKRPAPLPVTTFDAGVVSAETLGRGGTIASNRATPAAAAENPAALDAPSDNGSLYVTTLLSTRSDLPQDAEDATDPLQGKTIQYLAVKADKGVLFYQPISRLSQRQTVDAALGTTQQVDVDANAIGFAGANKWGAGSFGLSIAYLWSSLNVVDRTGSTITGTQHDNMDGLRLNMGLRYPTGPAMWGLLVQNAPAFLWGSEFRREQLPLSVRVGNTYRVSKGILLSLDYERRYYDEGSKDDDFIYIGNESFLGPSVVVRVGAFGTSLSDPKDRHATAGVTANAKNGTAISYAFEAFQALDEKIRRHVLSVQVPFAGE